MKVWSVHLGTSSMYQVAHYIISIGYYIYIDIISISFTHDDSRVSIFMLVSAVTFVAPLASSADDAQ